MGDNGIIILESVGVIISIACFNMFGIATTKNASAAQRSTIDTSRTLLIWILSVLLGLEFFHYESIFGFIFLVLGTLIYNEILIVPFFGFDQNTAVAIAARKNRGNSKVGQEEADAAYVALSPAAAYDSKRNQRQLNKQMEKAEQDYMTAPDADYNLNLSDNVEAHTSQKSMDQ